MPTYTVLAQSGKHRILRTHPDGTAAGVTTVVDADTARAIATALTEATSDLATDLVPWLLDHLDAWHLDPWEHGTAGTPGDWHELPAPTAPVALSRHALNTFDHGAGTPQPGRFPGTTRSHLHTVATVATAVAGQPAGVVRAVRDEIAAAYAPFDGVPVLAMIYDSKYDEYTALAYATPALPLLDSTDLDDIVRDPHSAGLHVGTLMGVLEDNGWADFADVADTAPAQQGWLSLDVNAAQLTAWTTTRTTP